MEHTLYIAQKLWSFWGRYEVKNERDQVVFYVQGQKSLLRKQTIYDVHNQEIGRFEQTWSIPNKFLIFQPGKPEDKIEQKWRFFHPELLMVNNGWHIQGKGIGLSFQVSDSKGNWVATINKEIWHLNDYFVVHYTHYEDGLPLLFITLALDTLLDGSKN